MPPNKVLWCIAGVLVLAVATVFSWLAFDLQRRDRDILKLRAETERLGSEVAKAAVDRDVAIAKCRVLESALTNARKRESVSTTTGRETTVTVTPAGDTITHTVEPATSISEIVSEPTLPPNTVVNAPAGDPESAPNTHPQPVVPRVVPNSLSLFYETDEALGVLYQREYKRWMFGAGFSFRQRGIISAGYTF